MQPATGELERRLVAGRGRGWIAQRQAGAGWQHQAQQQAVDRPGQRVGRLASAGSAIEAPAEAAALQGRAEPVAFLGAEPKALP